MIDLRSDTVTKPTPGMLDAMFSAKVGDDVFQEDEGINELQEYSASLFGHEAGLFCPSGTMTNQIAVNVHTQPGDELICSDLCHIYNYEGGGVARNSGVQVKLVSHPKGLIYASDIAYKVNPPDSHYANTSLVSLEDTVNKAGGVCYDLKEIKRIKTECATHGLSLHLDGARVFNALVESGEDLLDYGSQFDSISICLSKGLGSPSGSVLLGSKEFISKAHRVRKAMGGGMRQAGYFAAAGTFALKHQVKRLKEDHQRARQIATLLEKTAHVTAVTPPETNIIIFDVDEAYGVEPFLAQLRAKGVYALPFSKTKIRFVTHLHITDSDAAELEKILKHLS
ncbi:MAG: low specificity L-threonine aldolase [Flavobacteriales bacterium]